MLSDVMHDYQQLLTTDNKIFRNDFILLFFVNTLK